MTIAESHAKVSDGLGGPGACRVRCDPDQVDASGGVFDDEQDMEPSQQRCVDTGKVGGDDCFGLGVNELGPGGPGPVTGRVDTGGLENFPDCGRSDAVSKPLEFSVDSPVSPSRVLAGQSNDQPAELGVDWWSSSRFVW